MNATSLDAELSELGHDSMNFVGSMVCNQSKVEKRFINLFQMSKEEQRSKDQERKEQVSKASSKVVPFDKSSIVEEITNGESDRTVEN